MPKVHNICKDGLKFTIFLDVFPPVGQSHDTLLLHLFSFLVLFSQISSQLFAPNWIIIHRQPDEGLDPFEASGRLDPTTVASPLTCLST